MTALPVEAGLSLVLGSASPRRRELLGRIGLVPDDTRPPDIDETPHRDETPRAYVARIARQKAGALDLRDGEVALCADTTVALGRRILGKPEDADEARAFLRALSGRRHRVITSVAVRRGDRVWQKHSETSVSVKRLSPREIEAYIATGDWQGKAGGYAIQGPAGAFIPAISGDYSGVMGLPLSVTVGLLQAAGYPVYGEAS
ncbi:septum formation protein Maf [Ponticoccus sp. SC2-23]|uniref:Maf family protein n=1 Tax=Alexandriicola marinus TaxID=2081710 RepID=UPI000FD766F1|nr:Maf family protein [Alexandriicola marinus]MBM1222344.1 septum formation protein Maf [Ponticoccus sp. SC6-9]MBM1224457.1 septum formation protein Maf [Ponticoccus sp. SC6-15]MBM1229763.1 septum formation protein Maf [Ponticoccus sp. SC6-38]MBM1233423.1 septum formation protein Maf [Ponticoccus sp. SC6-45]MBM1236627.1 septum formation protein Maf [Ponticoccus sp. SC6-49]MBM1244671.1 septum formation protein Maf [Ponticoccus sp. SC2-64]MBM1246947.1 septum formation protein Maf [Ponticoccus 